MSYPKWIYSKELEAKIVYSKEEHEAHKGWEEAPFAKPEKQDETPQEPKTDQDSAQEAPKTYKEHMSDWVSKEEKKKPRNKKKAQ